MARERQADIDLVGALLGVGGVDDAGIDFTTGHVIQDLPHAVAVDERGLEGLPESGALQGVTRITAHRHAFGRTHGDALGLLELGKAAELLALGGHDEDDGIADEILAAFRLDELGFLGLVHGLLVGGGEHVHRGPFLHLLEQRVGGGKIGMHGQALMGLFERGLEFGKGIGQAGRRGNGHLPGGRRHGLPAAEGQDKGGHGQGHAFATGGKHSFEQHTSLLGFFMFLS